MNPIIEKLQTGCSKVVKLAQGRVSLGGDEYFAEEIYNLIEDTNTITCESIREALKGCHRIEADCIDVTDDWDADCWDSGFGGLPSDLLDTMGLEDISPPEVAGDGYWLGRYEDSQGNHWDLHYSQACSTYTLELL